MFSIEQIDEINSHEFLKDFFQNYFAFGFGSLSKHDLDLLIYYLIENHSNLFEGKSEYELSSILKLTESKLKKIQIESYLKYNSVSPKENLKKITKKINKSEIKPELEGDKIRFLIDCPVLKRDFEYAITSLGYIVDYSFNKNILSLRLSSFFEVINSNNSKEEKELKEKIISCFKVQRENDADIERELENKSWWKEQLENLRTQAKAETAKVILTSIIAYLQDVMGKLNVDI